MGSINKRTITSYKIMVSVADVKRYKEVVSRKDMDSMNYCEAVVALEHAIPEWLARKAKSIAKEIQFMQQIFDAIGYKDSALTSVTRNLNHMEGWNERDN